GPEFWIRADMVEPVSEGIRGALAWVVLMMMSAAGVMVGRGLGGGVAIGERRGFGGRGAAVGLVVGAVARECAFVRTVVVALSGGRLRAGWC
ncbi:MAG: hypothetical protein Q9225_001807, partial [Loekoesia sp. 1 TL-2023]